MVYFSTYDLLLLNLRCNLLLECGWVSEFCSVSRDDPGRHACPDRSDTTELMPDTPALAPRAMITPGHWQSSHPEVGYEEKA